MKVGIALGGGGARGFAHIGVLKVLEEAGISIDIVSGTSIGALVGAVYASGSLDKLLTAATEIKLTDIPLLMSPSWSLGGIFSGKNALELLQDFVTARRIEELAKPFAAVSVDLKHSSIETFTSGDISQAVRASIAIPGVFTPVCSDGKVLVDGGTLDPVPVRAARALGADIVIAVDLFGAYPAQDPLPDEKPGIVQKYQSALTYIRSLSSKLRRSGDGQNQESVTSPTIIEVIENTLAVSQQHLTKLRFKEYPADVVIAPRISSVGLLDFHRGLPVVDIGARAAREALPAIRACLESRGVTV